MLQLPIFSIKCLKELNWFYGCIIAHPWCQFDRQLRLIYSKTPIYRGVWGQGNNRGKSGSAVNRGAVNRGFTVHIYMYIMSKIVYQSVKS